MSDIFFDADAHDPSHWRYWKPLIVERDGVFCAKVGGELKPVDHPSFRSPTTKHEAAHVATFLFGGRPLPARPK